MQIHELKKLLQEFPEVNAEVCVNIDGKLYDIVGEDPEIVGFGHYICLEAVDKNRLKPWKKSMLKNLGMMQ